MVLEHRMLFLWAKNVEFDYCWLDCGLASWLPRHLYADLQIADWQSHTDSLEPHLNPVQCAPFSSISCKNQFYLYWLRYTYPSSKHCNLHWTTPLLKKYMSIILHIPTCSKNDWILFSAQLIFDICPPLEGSTLWHLLRWYS